MTNDSQVSEKISGVILNKTVPVCLRFFRFQCVVYFYKEKLKTTDIVSLISEK